MAADIITTIALSGQNDVIEAFGEVGKAGEEAFAKLAESVGPIGEALAGLGAAFSALIGATFAWAESSTQAAHALEMLAQQAGESVESISALEGAISSLGGSTDGLQSAFRRMGMTIARTWDEIKKESAEAADKQEEDIIGVEKAQQRLAKAKAAGDPMRRREAELELSKAERKADDDRLNSAEAYTKAVDDIIHGQQTFKQAGGDANLSVQNVIKGLIKDTEGAGEAFKNFNGNLNSLAGEGPKVKEVFYNLADFVKNSGDASLNSALMMRLFGRTLGAEVLPALMKGSGALKENEEAMKKHGLVMTEEMTAPAVEFHEAYNRLSHDLSITTTQMGLKFDPAFTTGMQDLTKYIEENHEALMAWGSDMANTITPYITGFFDALKGLAAYLAGDKLDPTTNAGQWEESWQRMGAVVKTIGAVIMGVIDAIKTALGALGLGGASGFEVIFDALAIVGVGKFAKIGAKWGAEILEGLVGALRLGGTALTGGVAALGAGLEAAGLVTPALGGAAARAAAAPAAGGLVAAEAGAAGGLAGMGARTLATRAAPAVAGAEVAGAEGLVAGAAGGILGTVGKGLLARAVPALVIGAGVTLGLTALADYLAGGKKEPKKEEKEETAAAAEERKKQTLQEPGDIGLRAARRYTDEKVTPTGMERAKRYADDMAPPEGMQRPQRLEAPAAAAPKHFWEKTLPELLATTPAEAPPAAPPAAAGMPGEAVPALDKVSAPANAAAASLDKLPAPAGSSAEALAKIAPAADAASAKLQSLAPASDKGTPDKTAAPAGDAAAALDKVSAPADAAASAFGKAGSAADGLAARLNSVSAPSGGGAPAEGKAGGGAVGGWGSGKSDSNIIRASKGEFVVTADGSNLGDAIRYFGGRHIPGFQEGGPYHGEPESYFGDVTSASQRAMNAQIDKEDAAEKKRRTEADKKEKEQEEREKKEEENQKKLEVSCDAANKKFNSFTVNGVHRRAVGFENNPDLDAKDKEQLASYNAKYDAAEQEARAACEKAGKAFRDTADPHSLSSLLAAQASDPQGLSSLLAAHGSQTASAVAGSSGMGWISGRADGGVVGECEGCGGGGTRADAGRMIANLARAFADGGLVNGFASAVTNIPGYASGGPVNGSAASSSNTLGYHALDIRTNSGNFTARVDEDTMEALRNSSLAGKLSQTGQRPSWYS